MKKAPYDTAVTVLSSYLGGTACACGTVSTQITVPTGANSAYIHAAGGAIYWNLGGTVAATTSPGYVAQDLTGYIPPIDNMRSTIPVIGSAAGAVAYVEFFQS